MYGAYTLYTGYSVSDLFSGLFSCLENICFGCVLKVLLRAHDIQHETHPPPPGGGGGEFVRIYTVNN